MIKKIFVYFLVLCITPSCAIHKDFPYICFLPGCIASQFGLPGIKEVKARSKSRRKTRQAKRLRQRSKKDNIRDNYRFKPGSGEEEEPVAQKKDSLKYSFSSAEETNYIVVRFTLKEKNRTDSLHVRYPESSSDISSYDKQLLKIYIDSNKPENVEWISIREHTGIKEDDKYYERHNSPVKKKLSEFFIDLGIPAAKIKIQK